MESDEDTPETQPFDDSQSRTSQSFCVSPVNYWGRLYPLARELKPQDLVENEVLFSEKSICDLKEHHSFSERTLFKIKRKIVKFRGLAKATAQFIDKSEKGILVNDRKLQRNSRLIALHTNDKISLPIHTGGHYDAYVFINSCDPIPIFPSQVTRHYQITYRLGVGAFGEVFLAFDKATCRPLAMKSALQSVLHNNDDSKKQSKLINECNILRAIDHPHVISLKDVVECKTEHFMFLEFMEGRDLSERVGENRKLQESIAKLYFYQLSKAVEYLHKQGIIHRDIKPGNVLLASASEATIVKLTDFGLSKILTATACMRTVCGTKMYAAPELLSGGSQYNSQVDIWSLGVLLYTCLSGTEPFSVQPHLIEKHIMRSLYVMLPEKWRNISTFAKNLVDTMLLTDPSKRIGINGILEDVWLQDAKMYAKLKHIYKKFGLSFNDD